MEHTPTQTDCPPLNDLRRLLLHDLSEGEAARIRNHLRDCEACRKAWQGFLTETVAPQTPPILQAIGDTNPGKAQPPAPVPAVTWSSEIGVVGPGAERAPDAPRAPSVNSGAASYPFLSPPREAGEIGWLGSYRISGVLGEGGMGYVFDAFDAHLQRRVALKVLKPELAANLSFRERFLQEARAAAALPDEHIITIYQVGMENDAPFLAMKFLHGESLEHRIQRDGRLPIIEVLRIGREIALGLSAAHDRGLIHRDIKPANLWLETPPPDQGTSSGERLSCEYVYRVKVLDFGLARPINDSRRLTATGLIVGTPSYLAPEQARGQPLDHRCDLFSLGIVLYRLVTGVLPFDGSDTLAQLTALAVQDPRPVEELVPETPASLRDLIHQLLSRNPADRPPTARAVAEALRALEKGDTPAQEFASLAKTPTRKPARAPRPSSRRRWLAAGGLLALLLAGGLLWRHFHSSDGSPPAALPPAGQEPIKLGLLFSLQGPMANTGSPSTDVVLLAIDELNKQGGLLGRRIEPVVRDGESDLGKFARLAEQLIVEDRVCTIIGCRSSASRKTVRTIVEKHNHLLLYPMQFEGLEQSPNIIYLGAAPNQQIVPALDYMLGIQRKRRLFLLGSDYVFPHAANEIIRDEVRRYPEAQIVGEKYIPFGSNDVSEAIRAIVVSKPDLILNTINGDTNASFFRALPRAEIRPEQTPVLSFSITENDLRSLRSEGVGHFAAWSYFQSIERPENREFIRKFHDRFGPQRVISDPMETAYFGIHLWAQAVQAAGSTDPRAIRQAMKRRSMEAPEGKVQIDAETGYTWRILRMGRVVENGQFEVLWSSEVPRRPVPFPASRTPAAWETFLQDLFHRWHDSWEAPAP
jgi:urea transport system substrate-binding protein